MAIFLARRFALAALSALLVTIIGFTLLRLAPGDPAELIALARYGQTSLSAAEINVIRHEERLDSPLPAEYLRWLSRVLRGDFGRSLVTGQPVLDEIRRRLPATLELAFATVLLSLATSIPVGVIAAVRKNSWLDRLIEGATLVGVSLPPFWTAYLLILLFAVRLDWLPASGRGGVEHLVLPATSIAIGLAAVNARLTRSGMLEALAQRYVRTAIAKGLTNRAVLIRHALPNAITPVLALSSVQFGFLIEGAVVTETVFAWPGIGRMLVEAVFDRDFPVMQACLLVVAAVFLLANLTADIAQALLDPRARQWHMS
jgi:peptide/nickel transport system permease protein